MSKKVIATGVGFIAMLGLMLYSALTGGIKTPADMWGAVIVTASLLLACIVYIIVDIYTPRPEDPSATPSYDESKLPPCDSGYVYLIRGDKGWYKIGHTIDPTDRMKTFRTLLPFEVSYEHLIPCKDRLAAEKWLHTVFAHRRGRGEWFKLTTTDINVIKGIASL